VLGNEVEGSLAGEFSSPVGNAIFGVAERGGDLPVNSGTT